jgi:hypothetical protein
MRARVYPRSLEMHKRLLKSILKQSNGYFIYLDYIKDVNIRNKGVSYIKLTFEEILEVADEMRACGKEMKYIEELIGQFKKV